MSPTQRLIFGTAAFLQSPCTFSPRPQARKGFGKTNLLRGIKSKGDPSQQLPPCQMHTDPSCPHTGTTAPPFPSSMETSCSAPPTLTWPLQTVITKITSKCLWHS